mgnify:CR=1 FL=1
MNKIHLESIIEKYYLDGLIERTRLNIKDNNVEIKFINDNKNLTGIIQANEFEFKDSEIGIYDTSQFLKLVSILNQFIVIKPDEKNNKIQKLLIADDEYNLEYPLADITIIPKAPNVDEPIYEVEFDINKEFITKFLKAYKVLKIETLIVDTYLDDGIGKIRFTIGENTNFSNKIDFSLTAEIGIPMGPVLFPINEFAAILNNNKDLEISKCYISEQGLLKLYFENKNKVKSTYILIGKE